MIVQVIAMRFLLTLSIFLFFAGNLISQNDPIKKRKIDSLEMKLKTDSLRLFRFNKFRPFANIDNRNSFIIQKPVNFKGVQLGIIFKEYHVFGFGYYTMTQKSQRPIKAEEQTITYDRYLNLNYYTFFYQYVLLDKRFVEIDLPFEIGSGKYSLKLMDPVTHEVYRTNSRSIIPLGAGLQVVLKPVRWVGFCVMGGYRYVYEKSVNLNFNGLYYSFGLWLDIRQIYRDIKFYGPIKKKYKKAMHEIMAN